jgi:hypothetical protein
MFRARKLHDWPRVPCSSLQLATVYYVGIQAIDGISQGNSGEWPPYPALESDYFIMA